MTTNGKQLLHFVFGGELKDLSGTEFRDLSKTRYRRHFSRLRVGGAGLESQGAGNGGQCPYALFRGASASSARPFEGQDLSVVALFRSRDKSHARRGSAPLKYPGPP